MATKSLQINVNSIDDAKAVVASQAAIKAAYEAHGCTSVDLCVAEEVVTPTAKILVGMFGWCTHYRRILKPFEGNVLFQLPHYCPRAASTTAPAPAPAEPPKPEPVKATAPRPTDIQRRPIPALPKPNLGKTAAPVPPPSEGA